MGDLRIRTEPFERVLRRVSYDRGCWVWPGATDKLGYGVVQVGTFGHGKLRQAHRLVYEALVEPIAEGLVIDHLCRNEKCVNPLHLEPVTIGENSRRGASGEINRARMLSMTDDERRAQAKLGAETRWRGRRDG